MENKMKLIKDLEAQQKEIDSALQETREKIKEQFDSLKKLIIEGL